MSEADPKREANLRLVRLIDGMSALVYERRWFVDEPIQSQADRFFDGCSAHYSLAFDAALSPPSSEDVSSCLA